MKNLKSDVPALAELSCDEEQQVSGGIGLVLLACLGGFYQSYNLGKVVGQEAYNYLH